MGSWSSKRKELTPEEAIAAAKQAVSSQWYGADPLFIATRDSTGVSTRVFSKSFFEHPALLCFVDPTTLGGESLFIFSKEMHRRYASHGLQVFYIFKPTYSFYPTRRFYEFILRRYGVQFQLVVDTDYGLSDAFEVLDYPAVRLLHGGKTVFGEDSDAWRSELEPLLLSYLRKNDPGYSSLPLFEPKSELYFDTGRLELGYRLTRKGQFLGGGFHTPVQGGFMGDFSTGGSYDESELLGGKIGLQGQWIQEVDRLVTHDKKATLDFICEGSVLSVVAVSLKTPIETTKLYFDLPGGAIDLEMRREDLVMDDEGNASIRLQEQPRLYQVFKKLPEHRRHFRLRFTTADKFPMAIYGIRMGEAYAPLQEDGAID